ncbi:MAG TPA: hypothetical protein PKC43_14180 [Phycisphaerales bacterium]|nr:hypothetical protein [Phycisphaerales bacterium]HMP38581.1 hypothetical protein [Phycisphaerales bacterium]
MPARLTDRRCLAPPLRAALIGLPLALAACASDQMRRPAPVVLPPDRQGYVDAGRIFSARAPQPGERFPDLWSVGLDGRPIALDQLRNGGSMLVVTASITSPIARRQQADLELIARRWGDCLSVIVLYTIEAHPTRDASPYSGLVWVPAENVRDRFQFRQPTTLMDRMILARQFNDRFVRGATLVVDPMDNVGWRMMGHGPNVALLVDEQGEVVMTQGWFDLIGLGPVLERRLGPGRAAEAVASPTAIHGSISSPDSPTRGWLPPGLAPELAALFAE